MGGKDALAQVVATGLVGLFLPVRVFQTVEREYEGVRVPLNADAARREAFACAEAWTDVTDFVGLFLPVRVFQTVEREYEEVRVPLNADAARRVAFARALAEARGRARSDAREARVWAQYDAHEDAVRATVAVEWTREIAAGAR